MRHTRLTTSRIATRSYEQPAIPISLNVISPIVASVDLLCIVLLAAATGYAYDVVVLSANADPSGYLGYGVAVATLYSAFAHAAGLYSTPDLLRLKRQIGRSLLIWAGVFVLLASLVFLLKIGAAFSRGKMMLFFSSGILMMIATRLAVARICIYVTTSRTIAPNQIVLVGSHDELAGNDALATLEQHGYAIAAIFQLPDLDTLTTEDVKSPLREVIRFVRSNTVDEVVLALPWSRLDIIQQVEAELRQLPMPVKLLSDSQTRRMLRRPLSDLGQLKAVELQRAPLSAVQRKLKRSMDQSLAAIGLFVLTPFMAIIALAIRMESPGPALFMQTRVGFNGQPFRIYKFRTMSTCDDGPIIHQATRQDKRTTHLGGLLRKLSIDEVPQLLNVLRGDMSLVGPRPHALAHDDEYDRLIATYAIRHKMKPGITGWAQVNGLRGETPELGMMEQRVESDIWYIEYWSLWLDIRILLLTVARVLKSDNAY